MTGELKSLILRFDNGWSQSIPLNGDSVFFGGKDLVLVCIEYSITDGTVSAPSIGPYRIVTKALDGRYYSNIISINFGDSTLTIRSDVNNNESGEMKFESKLEKKKENRK